MTGWQDIATAPRDGTVILAYGEYSSLYAINYTPSGPFQIRCPVVWDNGRWRMTTPEGENPLFDVWEAEWDGHQSAYMEPTHWMPLPPPPSE